MEAILKAAAQAGALSASWIMIRLPHEVAPLFREWLEIHFPERAKKIMAIIQSMRGGKDNDSSFHTRLHPKGVWADLLRHRFKLACQKNGLNRHKLKLDCKIFHPSKNREQFELF